MSNTSGNQGITGQLTNRCAVVTGGNKGMGLEICRQLAASGVFVILTARDEKRGLDAVENLKESGLSNVVYHQLDLKDSSSIASLANFISTRYKKLDILVNNAADIGVVIEPDAFRALPHGFGDIRDENPELLRGIMEQTHEKAEDCLKINYYGTKAVTEALLPFLQLSNSANIVNVSSAYGLLMFIHNEEVKSELNNVETLTEERLDELLQCFLRDFKEGKLQANGWPITVSAYKMSKAAVNAYTRMLARKFPDMRINCVHPGYVKTDITCDTGLLTVEEGAKGPVKLALLPDDGPTGHFLYDMNMTTFGSVTHCSGMRNKNENGRCILLYSVYPRYRKYKMPVSHGLLMTKKRHILDTCQHASRYMH